MEIRNHYVIYVVALIFVILYIFSKKDKKDEFETGKKVIGISYIKDEPYYKKKMRIYKFFSKIAIVLCLITILISTLILLRPYKMVYKDKEIYNRDIMLCLDVSTSVDQLNLELVNSLKDTVKKLKGERFGIVIFNTSPVLLVPLTDDYDYVINTLDDIAKSLMARLGLAYTDEWLYYSSYLEEGTLVNNMERGSSLIGDGLASAVLNFDKLDSDRSKSIILSTDNEVQGEPYYTLLEAANLCKENNIVLYGIGTKEMQSVYEKEMKEAVNETGGKFYIQEVDNITDIVKDINSTQKTLITSGKDMVQEDIIEIPYIMLVLSIGIMYISLRIIRC